MTYHSVDVRLHDHRGEPVSDALVRVYDSSGKTYFTEGKTDDTGRAGFLLENAKYSLRFHSPRSRIDQPRAIDVGGDDNDFLVRVERLSRTPPSSPSLCRITGTVRASSGAPAPNSMLRYTPELDSFAQTRDTIVAASGRVVTNERGEIDFELYRSARYRLELSSGPDSRIATIPDRDHVDLGALLSPEADLVHLDDIPRVGISEAVTLTPRVWSGAGELLENAGRGFVVWSTTDERVATVRRVAGYLVVLGHAQGRTTLIAHPPRRSGEPLKGTPAEVVVG